MRRPLAAFRVWCDRKRCKGYYDVMVFERERDMQDQYKKNLLHAGLRVGKFRNTGAACTFWLARQPRRRVGVVVLPLSRIDAGVVSHEMTHAALFWVTRTARDCRMPLDFETVERVAWVQGWLTTQFWRWWYRLDKRGAFPKIAKTGVRYA